MSHVFRVRLLFLQDLLSLVPMYWSHKYLLDWVTDVICKCAQWLVAIRDCDNYTFLNERREHVIILFPAASTTRQPFLQYAMVLSFTGHRITSCVVLVFLTVL